MKKKRKKKIKFNYIWIFGILSYILFKLIFNISNATISLYTVDYGEIVETITKQGIVIRDEKVILSKVSGKIDYFVKEGERIHANEQIAHIYIKDLDPSIKERLDTVNRRIEGINANKDEQIIQRDIEKIENSINSLRVDIKNRLIDNDISNIQRLKDDLLNLIDKKSLIIGEKSFVGKNINALKAEKNKLQEKVNSSVNQIVSESTGVISFASDGFEDILRVDTLNKLESDYLFNLKNDVKINKKDQVEVGDVIAKITNNHEWYIAIVLEEKEKEKFSVGKNLTIKKNDIDFSGNVKYLYKDSKNRYILVIEVKEEIENFYNVRKEEFEIVYKNIVGIKVPKSAVIDKDGKRGVYVVSNTGNAVFKELKSILGENKSDIILDYRDITRNNVDTVKLYDQIVLSPNRVSDGQKIR
ncbi:putative membrane fusion protein [Alkalithermobacter thermoalcaliphilus JW-YL-7 = DSM 7308]|uniref:Membrane fusion protein n=1 Tax=Alkalithermobacter thermoalcaliphilus JW-YL-7 = DSM 7308 TaxID=1121328 RepID=A0A150FPM0_CLOPD|nr:hypothetical protein JWYL7_0647 [[Clostridium] paradoxum JW-YL-7 = DSM 7308]SHK97504.1 putative membrane fusion protein [[Clostridium] paradoxum JW-YL-7 = DSM 7308]